MHRQMTNLMKFKYVPISKCNSQIYVTGQSVIHTWAMGMHIPISSYEDFAMCMRDQWCPA